MAFAAPVDDVPQELTEAQQKELDAQNAERERREQDGEPPSPCSRLLLGMALEPGARSIVR